MREIAKRLISRFFPGPLTIILKKNEIIPDTVTAGLDTIAIRMPSSELARKFIKESGVPIAAPSANLSGSPSPTTYRHVIEDFKGKIPCILIGPDAKYGLESTVVDCTSGIPTVLRPGVVTLEQLKKVDRRIKLKKGGKLKSPGQRYRHYAPKARVILSSPKSFPHMQETTPAYIGISAPQHKEAFSLVRRCSNAEDYAKRLFSFFRECDRKRIKIIYAEKVPQKGIGLAIMNRLNKAVSH